MTDLYRYSSKGKGSFILKDTSGIKDYSTSIKLKRETLPVLPSLSENEVVRIFTRMSKLNYGVDDGLYPLGSCTMKYNPKINEKIAAIDNFICVHPDSDDDLRQGTLEVNYRVSNMLKEVTGMDAVTLQPAAGSQGELTGLMIIKKYHEINGNTNKTKIIFPDSAHGTNPASVAMAGFKPVEIKSGANGIVDLERLKEKLDEDVAGFMLTNPNTLGIFEKDILKIKELIHNVGGLLYYDGANMNANMGITSPKLMGFDIVHLNLHKTMSTPHGGGGPGSGPVAVVDKLKELLPSPIVVEENGYYSTKEPKNSIGQVKGELGNFSVYLRALTYMMVMGSDGLKLASELAVLNANYMKSRLTTSYNPSHTGICKHEFVLAGLKDAGDVRTVDVAKRLIDYKLHPPTIYFPLIVKEALMIEPTETESLESLNNYIDVMLKIAKEAKENPKLLHDAPVNAPIKRPDEIKAAREPKLRETFDC